MHVVAAVDKFRGTATAADAAAAIGHACWELGHGCTEFAMADGGEGLIEVLGGANRTSTVTGPLGQPVEAAWRYHGDTAVIEMAAASGLTVVGGSERNDPLGATTAGVGELIMLAASAGARRIIVGLGGSATTDGGLGAIEAIANPARLRGIEVVVAHDVLTRFTDAATVFGPQKGASSAQVRMLTRRLTGLAERYVRDYGVDVTGLDGAGAAGGLAGGLVAIGGTLVPGFELVADELNLYDAVDAADIIITGEGYLDAESFNGKVVGGVTEIASDAGVPVGAIVGAAAASVADRIAYISLVDLVGDEMAFNEPLNSIGQAVAPLLDLLRRPTSAG